MNSRIFCYQVIPCLQWQQKWLDVNHAVNNTPVQKADATANCRAWDAQRNHNLSASVRSLGLSPSLTLLPGRMPWLVAQGLSPLLCPQLNPRMAGDRASPRLSPGQGSAGSPGTVGKQPQSQRTQPLLKYLPFVSISTSLPLKINNLVWKP